MTPRSSFDFGTILHEGDTVAWPQGTGEPRGLTRRLVAQRSGLPRIRLFVGMTTSDTLTAACTDRFDLIGLNGAGMNRHLTSAGALTVMPLHVSAVPRLIRAGRIKVDVALVRARATGRPGELSVGVVADYTRALIENARCVVAEMDERLPLTGQDALIATGQVHFRVAADADEILLPDSPPSAMDRAVAAQVAAVIPDRATVQLGIGGLPVAVAEALFDHRELGIHSGVVSDILVDLVEKGVVSNAYKGLDDGRSVTGALFGSRRLNDFAHENPALELRSVEHTHSIAIMAQLHALHSVNSAIEVDLTGQVNSELAGGRYLGAVGGQVDFVRGSQLSPGGRSIIALPSTTPDGRTSRIVMSLEGRPVTTARSDVDMIVTEYGVADLRGASFVERRRRLAAIAHPEFRDRLLGAAEDPDDGPAEVSLSRRASHV